jgi:hypothetical protein
MPALVRKFDACVAGGCGDATSGLLEDPRYNGFSVMRRVQTWLYASAYVACHFAEDALCVQHLR